MTEPLDNLETFQKAAEWMRICRTAVCKAQEESRRLGVANVYSIRGQLYYELPNGDYTRTRPESWGNPGESQRPAQ